jgi:hydroxyacylglutathione hydrolase
VLFSGSVGRTDRPDGDWATLLDSISRLLERFPPDTVVYSGHGPPTTLGDELARNPFLAELRA